MVSQWPARSFQAQLRLSISWNPIKPWRVPSLHATPLFAFSSSNQAPSTLKNIQIAEEISRQTFFQVSSVRAHLIWSPASIRTASLPPIRYLSATTFHPTVNRPQPLSLNGCSNEGRSSSNLASPLRCHNSCSITFKLPNQTQATMTGLTSGREVLESAHPMRKEKVWLANGSRLAFRREHTFPTTWLTIISDLLKPGAAH